MGYLFWLGAIIFMFYVIARVFSLFHAKYLILDLLLMVVELAGTICVSAFIFIFLDFLGWVRW
jgi:hypothetical protein